MCMHIGTSGYLSLRNLRMSVAAGCLPLVVWMVYGGDEENYVQYDKTTAWSIWFFSNSLTFFPGGHYACTVKNKTLKHIDRLPHVPCNYYNFLQILIIISTNRH